MDKQATNLVDALRAFGPAALEFGAGDHPFYVNRDDEPLREIRTWLLRQQGPAKFLLAGHRGSGKSTELNRLAARPEIQARYAVVKFSVLKVLDVVDLDYIDLLFQSAAITFNRLVSAASEPLELAPDTIGLLDRWRRTVSERIADSSQGMGTEVEAGGGLDVLKVFFARFQGRLQVEHTTRKITREAIEPRLSDFLRTLEVFYGEIDLALASRGQRLLLILEDLDKIPDVEKARVLFSEKGAYLTQPPCSVVYTVPIAIHYDPEFQRIASTFGHSIFLPNVPLHRRDGKPYKSGRALMEGFVGRRITPKLIERSALSAAVTSSGGVLQQIQRLMEKACLRTLGFERATISKADVEHAARDLQFELERGLGSQHYKLLDEVELTSEAPSDPEVLRLLHALHLVEYRNAERWCRINPLLKSTLKRWRDLETKRTQDPQ